MKRTAAATILAPISWGTTYVTITELLPADRPLAVAWLRVAPAGLLLLAVGRWVSAWRPHGVEWARTTALALCNFGVFLPLLFVAVYRLPGGVAAAVGGVQPLLVALVTWLVVGQRPLRRDVLVGIAAALGVAMVVVRPGAHIDPVGVGAALAANVSFSLGVVLTKRFPAPANRVAATGWQLVIGAMVLAPLALLVEGAPPALTGTNLLGVLYLSGVGTALAYVVWFRGIRRLPSIAPPLLGLAAPVTGAVMGWAVLGQALSPVQLVGFAVTIAAIAYGATRAGAPPLGRAGADPAPVLAPPPVRLAPVVAPVGGDDSGERGLAEGCA